ncbi:hypothetical protein ACFWYW_23735 [Nonomuraea sp. NPDC059023]|uniref:hypothetical protein n=1 Tax=Nonomuraea sp. NPDC059023 TaxID=3346706 RepID=UPI0036A9922B
MNTEVDQPSLGTLPTAVAPTIPRIYGSVHWIRRSKEEAGELVVFDDPSGSEKGTEELWQKIISREAV